MLLIIFDFFAKAENPHGSLLYCWLADVLQVAVSQNTQPTRMSQCQGSPADGVVVLDHLLLVLAQPIFPTSMNRLCFESERSPPAPFFTTPKQRLFPLWIRIWQEFV